MVDVPGQPPVLVESMQTHTPLDPMRRPWRVRRSTTKSYEKAAEPAPTCASTLSTACCATCV